MLSSFKPFSRLPPELRDRIWGLAVRPTQPGVQIFNLGCYLSEFYPSPDLFQGLCPKYYRISAPEATSFQNMENPSTYLLDAGLWTACRESSQIITKSLCRGEDESGLERTESATRLYRSLPDLCIPIQSDGQGTAMQECPIKLCSGQDLMVFRVDEDTNWIERRRSKRSIVISRNHWGFRTPHVGWEYNPVWVLELDHDLGTNVLDLLCSYAIYGAKAGGLQTMWFINYDIKRKPWVPSEEEARRPASRTFEIGKQRFVEVDVLGACYHHPTLVEPAWYDQGNQDGLLSLTGDFLSFIHLVKDIIFITSEHDRSHQDSKVVDIGILACEDL